MEEEEEEGGGCEIGEVVMVSGVVDVVFLVLCVDGWRGER